MVDKLGASTMPSNETNACPASEEMPDDLRRYLETERRDAAVRPPHHPAKQLALWLADRVAALEVELRESRATIERLHVENARWVPRPSIDGGSLTVQSPTPVSGRNNSDE